MNTRIREKEGERERELVTGSAFGAECRAGRKGAAEFAKTKVVRTITFIILDLLKDAIFQAVSGARTKSLSWLNHAENKAFRVAVVERRRRFPSQHSYYHNHQ